MSTLSIVWFRRDLRVHDHPALIAAVSASDVVLPLFVFDDALLGGRWPAPNRLWFMRESLAVLDDALGQLGGRLWTARGRAIDLVPAIARTVGATGVYLTRDASPYGRRRDAAVADALAVDGIAVHAKRGLYVHEPDELATRDGEPFRVYSPFRRAWAATPRRDLLPAPGRVPVPTPRRIAGLRAPGDLAARVPALDELGLPGPTADPDLIPGPGEVAARERLAVWLDGPVREYAEARDRLDLEATSRLSQDLRWGLLSPTEVVERAAGGGVGRRTFVSEVAWRDFYAHVLWHHPQVTRSAFQPAFDRVAWRTDDEALAAWSVGRTGYPVVDAAMRQLRGSGFVHNRARMVAASFLTKDLLIDWRAGERVFMEHLTDGDLASNNGGWQWAASTGTDPQPWFRIFNPVLQGERHDPDGAYVRRWVPELAHVPDAHVHAPWTMPEGLQHEVGCVIGRDYPAPIVDHLAARERALAAYAAARDAG